MKWSELFANILGDKDVDVSKSIDSNISVPPVSQEHSIQNSTTVTESEQKQQGTQPVNTSVNSTTGQNLTQEQFDALNARIAELEKANRELVLTGSENQQPAATPESLIYSLCVERGNYGNKTSTSSDTAVS